MRKTEIKEKIFDFSCGVLATAIDVVLFSVLYGLEVGSPRFGPPNVARAAREVSTQTVELGVDKETIKRAIWKAKHRHLIRRSPKGIKSWRITKEGKRRLAALIPQYDEKRIWDGRLYLVIYDIPEKNRRDRNVLREYLKKIGCGMLQISVWLTPYNPSGTLRDFIKEKNLSGAVIVSDIGQDGSIGNEDLDDLISRVYDLNWLNNRYERFVYQVRRGNLDRAQTAFSFLSILIDDPQLPFELLPYNWWGKKAYDLFKEKCNPSS